MLRLVRARHLFGIAVLWASSLALTGCGEDKQASIEVPTPDAGASGQAGRALSGDPGATSVRPASDVGTPGRLGPAVATDGGRTAEPSTFDTGAPKSSGPVASDPGRASEPSTLDAGASDQPGSARPDDAGHGSVPPTRDAATSSETDASLTDDAGLTTGPLGPDTGTPTNRPALVSGDSVFFVGNSFFESFDRVLPDWVSAIGKAVSPPITIHTGRYVVPGNLKLSWFLQQPESQNALASGAYKVFVIQAEEREPVDATDAFKQAVRDWNQAIVASGATTMLFMTWDLPDEKGTTFFEKLATAYDEIGDELGIPVIPVGRIYDDCNKDPFPGKTAGSYWLTDNALHQVETGSAVNAYATFSMLTGVNPMGCPIDAPANSNSPEMLKYLSDMSWARVAPLVTGNR